MIYDNEYFKNEAKKINVELTDTQVNQFYQYYNLVIENNKLFNLTAITEGKDFIDKHYIDSMIGIDLIPQNSNLLDIGSGAGFPSIPISIIRNDVKVTAIDSTAKKMNFVQNAANAIQLNNINTISGRVEDLKNLKNSFDVITARAVAPLQILLELAIPLLKINGLFIAYKTDKSELNLSENALKTLDSVFLTSKPAKLPNGDPREILVFKKIGKTNPLYPRQYGTIKKKPL